MTMARQQKVNIKGPLGAAARGGMGAKMSWLRMHDVATGVFAEEPIYTDPSLGEGNGAEWLPSAAI